MSIILVSLRPFCYTAIIIEIKILDSLNITSKIFYKFGASFPEKWSYSSKKCKLENQGCPILITKFLAVFG